MWGPHGGKWRHVERATSSGRWRRGRRLGGSPRLVGLARRIRRPPPETVTDVAVRAFFVAVGLLFVTPILAVFTEPLLGIAAETVALAMSGIAFAYWIVALGALPIPWRRRLFLRLASCAVILGIWLWILAVTAP